MTHRLLSWTFTVALLLSAGSASAEFKLDVREFKLDNGLTILMLENHAAPLTTYYTFFKVGSRNERVDNSGISHFFEHMMFNGAEKYGPKMFDLALESNGGYSNAYTSKNVTAYYEDFSSDILELVIGLESDRMANLALEEEMVRSEAGVVSEERLVGTDNDNVGIVYEELFSAAFMSHPYANPVLGWMESIKNFNREDCVEYFRTYYAPNNAVVAIVGDFDTDEALALMKQHFSSIPSGPPPPPVARYEPEQRGARRVMIERSARHSHIMRGYHVGDKDSPDLFAMEIVQFILITGESSRLYQTMVNDLEVAFRIWGGFSWSFDPTLFYFYVGAVPGMDYQRVEQVFDSVLTDLATNGPTDQELARAKNGLTANFYKNFKTNNGTAHEIAQYKTLWGDFSVMYDFVDNVNTVTAEEVRQAVEKYFTKKNSTTVVLVPEGGAS